MSEGRTTWWAKDAAWHRRELQVELGEEFGPAGLVVLDVLCCWAQEQRGGDGRVRGGYRALAREAFVSVSVCESVVTRAAEIGALDELLIDQDGRRFTTRVSGWTKDQQRGRSAWRQAAHRERSNAESRGVTLDDGLSRDVTQKPPPDQTLEEEIHTSYPPGRAREARPGEESPLCLQVQGILRRGLDSLTSPGPSKFPTIEAIEAHIKATACRPDEAIAAAVRAREIAQRDNRAPNIAGLFAQQLDQVIAA